LIDPEAVRAAPTYVRFITAETSLADWVTVISFRGQGTLATRPVLEVKSNPLVKSAEIVALE